MLSLNQRAWAGNGHEEDINNSHCFSLYPQRISDSVTAITYFQDMRKVMKNSPPLPSLSSPSPAPLLRRIQSCVLVRKDGRREQVLSTLQWLTRTTLSFAEDFFSQSSLPRGRGSALSAPLDVTVPSRKGRRTGALGTRQETSR